MFFCFVLFCFQVSIPFFFVVVVAITDFFLVWGAYNNSGISRPYIKQALEYTYFLA